MKYKEKILVQTVACMTIIALLNGTPIINSEKAIETKEKIVKEINEHHTAGNIRNVGLEIFLKTLDLPDSINKVISAANEIDYTFDNFNNESNFVRATAGGEVVYVGIDKEYGICIKVKNKSNVYTYGNLATIDVITGDRVIKSEILGTFDTQSDKELYYQVDDIMV